MATHTYMYRSTDINMEAHTLDMHTSVTPVLLILDIIINTSKLHKRAEYCNHTVTIEEILS